MGQVQGCCTVAEANDDTMYRPPPQEIEKPWKEKVETIEGKVVLAVDPNFTEEKIAQERMKILTNKELQKKSTTRFKEVGNNDVAELTKDFMPCMYCPRRKDLYNLGTACGYVTDRKKNRKIQ